MRLHELARELKTTGKDVVEKLHELKQDVKNNPMTLLSPEQVEMARKAFEAFLAQAAAAAARQAAPAASAPVEAAPAPAAAPAAAPAKAPEKPAEPKPAPAQKKVVVVKGPIIVKEFAEQLGIKPNQLIAALMSMNIFASINEKIEFKTAQQVAEKRGFVLEVEKKVEPKPVAPKPVPIVETEDDRPEDLLPRPPIVTFLGHVDHGKTSLMDKIRHSHVAQGEDGGITQHIGAYMVQYRDHWITFLDTPGHAAFTAMRARGANLTDIAVLVVAADDGVMPQTKEAIQHARAAKVAMIVAINKTDVRGANVDRVKRQLQQEGINPEDWGGDVICCPVSAMTGDGIDHLLEMILLQAEMLELKSNPRRRAQGYVIEARMEAGMGPTTNILVRRGTLQVGDALICGPYWGKVKALINDHGVKVRTALPSWAVKCLGLTSVPEPGMEFKVVASEKLARSMSEERMAKKRLEDISVPKRASLEDLMSRPVEAEKRVLSIVLKTDVQGSLEAIQQSLLGIKSDKVAISVVLAGVGNITENDVLLASASNAIIIGFHVGKEPSSAGMAKREGVEIRLYSVIYELLDDVRAAMAGLLEPIVKESVIGHAEVRQVFEISKKGKVAGCMMRDGRATSRCRARVQREGEVLAEGAISSLKRFQNDAAEVREGQECGIRLDVFSDFVEGDVIEFYEMEKISQQL